jgi:hypothetical protein
LEQLTRAVRANGAAGVFVRVDQRRERDGRFDGGIETQANFAQHRQIRTEAGRDDELVNQDMTSATSDSGRNAQLAVDRGDRCDGKTGLDLHLPRGNERGEVNSEFAAGHQLVVGAAAEGPCRIIAAQQPDHARTRCLLSKCRQVDQRADGRVPCPKHGDGLADKACAILSKNIRHAVGNLRLRFALADGRKPICACRVRRVPGARYVEDGIGA